MDASDAALDVLAILPALEPWLRQEIRSGMTKHLRFTFPQIWQAIVVQVGHGRYHVGLEEDKTAGELDPVETLLALAQREKSSDEVISELSSWYLPT